MFLAFRYFFHEYFVICEVQIDYQYTVLLVLGHFDLNKTLE